MPNHFKMNLLFLLLLVSLLLIFLIDSIRFGITPTPTSKKVRKKILDALPREIEGDLYELGSGFGQMAFDFAKKFQTHSVKSYERAKIPFWIQKGWLFLKQSRNISLFYEDFQKEDLSSAGLIFCYLYRDIMPKLADKFEKELKPGTWVISSMFAIESWKPSKTLYAADLYRTPIYIYRLPTCCAGSLQKQ